jgi:hypothetical protein
LTSLNGLSANTLSRRSWMARRVSSSRAVVITS